MQSLGEAPALPNNKSYHLATPSGLKRYSDQCRWCLNPRPQLQNNTTTKQHQTEGKGLGPPSKAPEPIRAERMRRSDDDRAAGAPPPPAAAAGREGEEEQEEGTAQQVVSPSSSSSRRRRRSSSEQQQRRSSSSRSADDDASSSSLLSQPGPQAAGRPRGNPRPPSDSGTHTDEAASKPLNNGVVLKSDDKKAESPSVKKSSKQTELVQKPVCSKHDQDKQDRCEIPKLNSFLMDPHYMAVNKSSETGLYLTGKLASGATTDSEEKARICQPELRPEEEDQLGESQVLNSFTGFGGTEIKKTSETGLYLTGKLASGATMDPEEKARICQPEKTSETGLYLTGKLASGATMDPEEKARICQPELRPEEEDQLGESQVLSSFTGFEGTEIKKTSETGLYLTGKLASGATMDPEEKARICQPELRPEEEDQLGESQVLNSFTGFEGTEIKKTSETGLYLTGKLASGATMDPEEKARICQPELRPEEEDQLGESQVLNSFTGFEGTEIKKTSETGLYLTGKLASGATMDPEEKARICQPELRPEEEDQLGESQVLNSFTGFGGTEIKKTSETGLYLTGKLASGATMDPEEKARICQPELRPEEEDQLGESQVLNSFTGFEGTEIKKTSETGLYLTGKLASGATMDPEEKARICQPELRPEEEDQLGESQVLNSFTGFEGTEIKKTSETGLYLTGKLASGATMDPEEKARICQPELRPEEEDQLGESQVLNSFTGFGGTEIKKTSETGLYLTGKLASGATMDPEEKARICQPELRPEEEDQLGESQVLNSFTGFEGTEIKKTSETGLYLTGKLASGATMDPEEKARICQPELRPEEEDQLGESQVLNSFTGFGGTEIKKTSETGLYLTGKLASGATMDPEEKARICQPELRPEEEDQLGESQVLNSFTGFGGTEIKKTSETGLYLTGKLASGATMDPEEKARICQPELRPEEEDQLGESQVLNSFTGFGGTEIKKTSETGLYLTGKLASGATMDPEEKARICQPELRPEEEDQLGESQVLNSFTGFGGTEIKKTSETGLYLTGKLASGATMDPEEKARICQPELRPEEEDQLGESQVLNSFTGFGGTEIKKTSETGLYLTGKLASGATMDPEEKARICQPELRPEEEDQLGESQVLNSFTGFGGTEIKKTSETGLYLTGKLASGATMDPEEKARICQPELRPEEEDQLGESQVLNSFTGFGGTEIKKTSETGLYLTGKLASGATMDPEEKARICQPELRPEEEDQLGESQVLNSFTGFEGTEIKKTSETGLYLTGKLASGATMDPEEKARICQPELRPEEEDQLGESQVLNSFTGFEGTEIKKTSETGLYLTGKLASGATMDPEEKARICQPELRPEEEDQLGESQVLNSFTGFEGTEINKTSETGSYLTGKLASGATMDPEEKARICQPELRPEEEDQLGESQVLNSFTGFEGTEIKKTSETGLYLTGKLASGATMDPEEKARICQPELRPEEEDQLGALQVLNSFTGFEGTEINKTSAGRLIPHG